MKPNDKRKILDQIFGILFFNKVNEELKDNLKTFKKDIEVLDGQLTILTDTSSQLKNKISSIGEKVQKDNIEKVDEIETQVENLINNVKVLTEEQTTLNNKKGKLDIAYQTLATEDNKLRYEMGTNKNKLSIYDNNVCPTCSSDLTTEDHQHIKDGINCEIEDLDVKRMDNVNKASKVKKALETLTASSTKINTSIWECKANIKSLNESKAQLNVKDDSVSEFNDILTNTLDKMDETLDSLSELKKNEYLYNELSKIFGEDGVKLEITRNFLPSFNKSINELSKDLHFPYKIQIDEKFNSKILSMGEEISTNTLSNGERKKADFAVLISLIRIMKTNYPNINLLFLDEILASIDPYGVYEMLKLIRNIVDESNITVFVINHSELPKEMFDYIYAVNKQGGFSELTTSIC